MNGAAREIELKLEIDGGGEKRVREVLPAGGQTRHLSSRYFDTPQARLAKSGLALRIRRDGERRVQTLKGVGDGFMSRTEQEAEVSADAPDMTALDGAGRAAVAEAGDLAPIFETAVRRTTWIVAQGGSIVEIALDQGEVAAGARSEPIREIELELKSGSSADLFELARPLVAASPVRIGVRSKSERGYDLLRAPHAEDGIKAEAVRLDPSGTAGEAFQVIARACFRQFRLNEPALLERQAPEALHQARVGLRRLRSCFTLFGDVIACPEADRLKRELRRVSHILGGARNLDIYRADTLRSEPETGAGQPGLGELSARVETERARAYQRVGRLLGSRSFRLLTVDLVAFVEAGPWLTDKALAKTRKRPAPAFAARVLRRRHRKVSRMGRRLGRLDPEARHEVRIEAKKLRYASEFFATLFPGRKAARSRKKFLHALENLQACLGDLNDIATGHELARRFAERPARNGSAAPQAGRPDGAGDGGDAADAREARLLVSAAAAHKGLRKADPFWR